MIRLVIGVPLGFQAMKLGVTALTPFGKKVVLERTAGTCSIFFDLIWFILWGYVHALLIVKLIVSGGRLR